MNEEIVIRKAEFNPRVCPYWLFFGSIICIVTIVGIAFLPFWLIFGLYITRRYLSHMECILTDKDLKVNKGIWTRVEKTIPLEKITDLGLVQGPIMRHFGIHRLSVETAGQSAQGPLVSLVGIVDVINFREAVLQQRDVFRNSGTGATTGSVEKTVSNDSETLIEIKEALFRIEDILKQRD